MVEIRIAKYTHVAQPSYMITFSIFNKDSKAGVTLDAVVNAADVEGKTEQEIAEVAWEQVRVRADEFVKQNSISVSSLLNKEFVPTNPWPSLDT